MASLRRGYTLVELVVVIAVLGVLAGIAVPRFVKATEAARGGQILANIYSCEEAINIYHTKTGFFPENESILVDKYLVNWPKPPKGKAIVSKYNGVEIELTISATSYVYVKPAENELTQKVGRVTLGGMTIDEILSTSESSLTLSDG